MPSEDLSRATQLLKHCRKHMSDAEEKKMQVVNYIFETLTVASPLLSEDILMPRRGQC